MQRPAPGFYAAAIALLQLVGLQQQAKFCGHGQVRLIQALLELQHRTDALFMVKRQVQHHEFLQCIGHTAHQRHNPLPCHPGLRNLLAQFFYLLLLGRIQLFQFAGIGRLVLSAILQFAVFLQQVLGLP